MAKWIALSLIVAGIISIVKAVRMDSRSSFHDGTFVAEMYFFMGGGALILAGLLTFAVLLFREL